MKTKHKTHTKKLYIWKERSNTQILNGLIIKMSIRYRKKDKVSVSFVITGKLVYVHNCSASVLLTEVTFNDEALALQADYRAVDSSNSLVSSAADAEYEYETAASCPCELCGQMS